MANPRLKRDLPRSSCANPARSIPAPQNQDVPNITPDESLCGDCLQVRLIEREASELHRKYWLLVFCHVKNRNGDADARFVPKKR